MPLHRRLAPLAALVLLAAAPAPDVKLEPASGKQFDALVTKPPEGTKYTLVDAWATYCPPCKENFPHLLEMGRKYGKDGLRVVSIAFDDPTDADALAEARKFLESQKATITNLVFDEPDRSGYEKFDIVAIPAVFVYDAQGKEVKRFTMDDPSNQFTYDQVEQEVRKLLGLPAGAN
jgi:thiol-disulfide isomerase/thioredoxin